MEMMVVVTDQGTFPGFPQVVQRAGICCTSGGTLLYIRWWKWYKTDIKWWFNSVGTKSWYILQHHQAQDGLSNSSNISPLSPVGGYQVFEVDSSRIRLCSVVLYNVQQVFNGCPLQLIVL